MPELPEVETVVRDLRPRLVGRRIVGVTASKHPLRRPWQGQWAAGLLQQRVADVTRRGKWILLRLDSGAVLIVHLGMTGQFVAVPAAEPLPDHLHLLFTLDGDWHLRFRDIRRFGSATLAADAEELQAFFAAAGLGPEPFDLDAADWRRRVQATGRCLKAMLLDQRVVAGVGNIYADESLFEAKLHPAQLGRDTTDAQANGLRRAIVKVLTRAIERRGSSIRDYVGGSGLKGGYQDEFRAYGRTGAPCRRCRTPIVGTRLAGRATHFCPKCQPAV